MNSYVNFAFENLIELIVKKVFSLLLCETYTSEFEFSSFQQNHQNFPAKYLDLRMDTLSDISNGLESYVYK